MLFQTNVISYSAHSIEHLKEYPSEVYGKKNLIKLIEKILRNTASVLQYVKFIRLAPYCWEIKNQLLDVKF